MVRKSFDHSPGFTQEQKLKEFEALAYPLMNHLYSTALKMTRNIYDAEDLVQETYLKSWRFLHKFEPGTNFRGWIFRILINNYVNLYQRKKRAPHLEDFYESFLERRIYFLRLYKLI